MMKKRVRMFAGPNGSGKSTIKMAISADLPYLFERYINPDEIEREIGERGFFDIQPYGIITSEKEILSFFTNSSFLRQVHLLDEAHRLQFEENRLVFSEVKVNAYFTSVAADFIRHKLLEAGKSFTFETVMSSPDKVEFLHKAQENGYRTYLYYVATRDPAINISRVRYRVQMGGHPVPEDKIVTRYERSLDLLMQAVRFSNRAYIFDNSDEDPVWLAEITDGKVLDMKASQMPVWFKKALWDKFNASA